MTEQERRDRLTGALDTDTSTPGIQSHLEDDAHLCMEVLIAEWESGLAEGVKRGGARGFLYGVVCSLFAMLVVLGFVALG